MTTNEITLKITKEQQGLSVKYLLSKELGLSRREITRLNSGRGIYLNGETCRLSEPVKEKDLLCITLKGKDAAHGTRITGVPTVLYEDAHIVIVNKPAGMPAHASKEHPDDDMGTLLRTYYKEQFSPRPVGRLDKDVSGIMIYAKDQKTAAKLSKQRDEQKLQKEYLAVVQGILQEKEGTLRYALARNAAKHNRRVDKNGQMCVTKYHVEAEYGSISLVRIIIQTGRTHQIRAGMAHYGHPLAGDRLYGGMNKTIHRPALHCAELNFTNPYSGEEVHISCALPEDIRNLLEDTK